MSDKSTFDVTKLQVPVINGLPMQDFAMFEASAVRSTRTEFNYGQEKNDDDVSTTGSTVTVTAKMAAGINALQRAVCGYDPYTDIEGLQLTDDDVQGNVVWRSFPSGDRTYYEKTDYYGFCTSVVTPEDASSGDDFLKGRFPMQGAPIITIQRGGVYAQVIDHTNGTGTLNAAFMNRTSDLDALDVFAVKVASDGQRSFAQITNGGAYVSSTAVAVPIHTTSKGDIPRSWNLTFDYLMVVGVWTGAGTHIKGTVPVTEMNAWSTVA